MPTAVPEPGLQNVLPRCSAHHHACVLCVAATWCVHHLLMTVSEPNKAECIAYEYIRSVCVLVLLVSQRIAMVL